jgi:glycosyltransferase involved in cell wall biosynthesis
MTMVIPACNEQDNLPDLYHQLVQVADEHHLKIDILFIDDGSTDTTWHRIRDLADADTRVSGIRFRRNFGKAAALAAGFQAARGEIIFTLDADLQDDPEEIPRFLTELDAGFDLVSGWKRRRHDPWHKVWPSRLFNFVVSAVTGVKLHDHNCGFKCYRAAVIREIDLYGEMHRFVPVLAHARGFRAGEIPVHHRPRIHGRSKYGVKRFVSGFLDLLTVKFLIGFAGKPAHFFGTVGLIAFISSAAGFIASAWAASTHGLIAALITAAVGVNCFSVGLAAELITARSAPDRSDYSIAEKTKRRASQDHSSSRVDSTS